MFYLADGYMMDGWGNGYGSGNSAWDWFFMFLMMLVFVLIGILVIRYLVREWQKSRQVESSVETLKRRYANGEIDKKEYQEKLKDIKT
jgi:uncharacterized membrane protein